jgi:hypothetical protein
MIRPFVAAGLLATACAALPRGAAAQTRPEPQLLLTIFGGAAGGPTLVTGLRQPLPLLEDPSSVDTIELGRRLSPGITLGASATYFPHANFGVTGEISFIGFGRDDTCSLVYVDPSDARAGFNEQICDNIAAVGGSASTIAFEVGGLLRFAPRGPLKPYLRAQGGFTTRSSSTVEVVGSFLDESLIRQATLIIGDESPSSFEPTGSFAVGIMVPFATGYQARLELRDRLLLVDRVSGPANALAQAPSEKRMFHSVALVIMLDIVLEQRRGRRY